MVRALILDSEAVDALSRATKRHALADRARAVLQVAFDSGALVRIPAPVLAEVCRGEPHDAAVNHLLNSHGIGVIGLTERMARRAGALLSRAKLDSEHTVDAFVAATAAELAPAVIATHDPDDFACLTAGVQGVRILAI